MFLIGLRPAKLVLLGPDYSHRLYTEVVGNLLVTLLLGVYLAIRRRWIAATAGFALGGMWLFVGVVNVSV
jgi:hypothetical protein